MTKQLTSLAIFAGVVLVAIFMLGMVGLLDWKWPWEGAEVAKIESSIVQPEAATVTEISPIALDCRARINAIVPIEGVRDHSILGGVYRTDRIKMTAIGDIDTCVRADSVEIITRADGTTRVIVPADAITFERPRVDAVATLDSVDVDRGIAAKLTDVFPWVSDNDGLTPAAYAYAQTVIGSSACMQEAYSQTQIAMTEAYVRQVVADGGSRSDIEVDIVGAPDFTSVTEDLDAIAEYDFVADDAYIECTVSPGATAGATAVGG